MRISGGDARGIRLKVPKGARPASERVRQAVFSSLAAHVPGARVLDLYCGSGAYGLEALSRGADRAVFVDADPQAVRAVRDNVRASGMEGASVEQADVLRCLRGKPDTFDIAFADPPYGTDTSELLRALKGVLAPGGLAVVESRWTPEEPDVPGGYLLEADRRYGDTRVLVLRRRERR